VTQPDILVFMSDQHQAAVMGTAGDPFVSTPHLDELADVGTISDNAYTSCPLCVPARTSMLTGQLPSHSGVFHNEGVLSSEVATFAHCLGAAGYETVLCGRMHFLGPDQRHGFTKRLVGDYTPCFHGRYGFARDDLGPYVGTSSGQFTKHYGGGTSPVLEYDRAVISAALDLLAKPHEKPLFLLVGTYGPHHTFVAPPELYRKYLDLLPRPTTADKPVFPVELAKSQRDFEPDVVHRLRAAYYGMVEQIDNQVGQVVEAWQKRVARTGREGVCCYLSDHGEQAGERRLWGKNTFYEGAARIPMIFAGSGVRQGRRLTAPCSIMDLGPTLCDWAAAESPPEQDGLSLRPFLGGDDPPADRAVIGELFSGHTGLPARMIRQGIWKYIAYPGSAGDDVLFDLEADPGETRNCLHDIPEVSQRLKHCLEEGWNPEDIARDQARRRKHWELLARWGSVSMVEEPDRWPVPRSAWTLPDPLAGAPAPQTLA